VAGIESSDTDLALESADAVVGSSGDLDESIPLVFVDSSAESGALVV